MKKKTLRGTGWSAIDAFLGHGITFIVGIVLARLLSPSEYGLIGIATIFINVLACFVDSGFSSSLIRKKDTTDDDYNTMFFTNLAVSILMYGLLYICSPLIAAFFNQPILTKLIRILGLIIIIQATSLVQYTKLSKRLDFKTKTKASFTAAIISGAIGITMAYIGFGVWALVGQQTSNKFIYTSCLLYFNKWFPKFRFNIDSFRYMWGFGWKLLVSGLLNNIWNQLYQVVVGKFYSPSTLGQYSRSREYAYLFSSNFTMIVQRVTYPALAKVQDDKQRMISAYRRIIKVSMFITAICMFFLGAVSEPLIFCLIGRKWYEAATYLPFICVSLSLYPLHAINLNMLQVQGRSDIFLMLEIIKKINAIGPLLLGIFVNIYWMLVGSIITGIIAFFLNSYYTGKKLGYSSFMQLKDISPSYALATIIAISVYFFKYLPLSEFIILPIQITVGVLVFFLICNIFKMQEYKELKQIIYDFIGKKSAP